MAKTPPKQPCTGITPGPGQTKCSSTQTEITPKSFGRETRVSRFLPHGAFTFTSPNAVPPPVRGTPCVKVSVAAVRKKDTKKQKRGETYFKKVDLPYACPTGTKFLEASGRCSDGSEPTPNRSCGSRSKPCSSVRQTCPVQFVFKNGEPHLRFCGERGKPAPLVKVEDPLQAQKLAQEACDEWNATTLRYGDIPGKGKVGIPGLYTKNIYEAPLGRLPRYRR
jgi:hypothetical protein